MFTEVSAGSHSNTKRPQDVAVLQVADVICGLSGLLSHVHHAVSILLKVDQPTRRNSSYFGTVVHVRSGVLSNFLSDKAKLKTRSVFEQGRLISGTVHPTFALNSSVEVGEPALDKVRKHV